MALVDVAGLLQPIEDRPGARIAIVDHRAAVERDRRPVGQHARGIERERIPVGTGRVLHLIVGIISERGFEEIDRREIEHVQPQHRLLRRIAVVVRGPVGGDHEIARRHESLLALDGRVGALAVEHEADCRRDVAMGRRHFARQDHLDAGKQRVGDTRLAAHGRILENEHPTLRLIGADQAARLDHQRFHVVVVPDVRHAAGDRLLGHDRLHHLPERGHVARRTRHERHRYCAWGRASRWSCLPAASPGLAWHSPCCGTSAGPFPRRKTISRDR